MSVTVPDRPASDLNKEQVRLLEEILRLELKQGPVDRKRFRLKHREQIDELDRLEQSPVLNLHHQYYVVSLFVFPQLDEALTGKIEKQCARLFRALSSLYKKYLDAEIPLRVVRAAASKGKVAAAQLWQCIEYLSQLGLITTWTRSSPTKLDGKIRLNEKIIRYSSFGGALAEKARRMSHSREYSDVMEEASLGSTESSRLEQLTAELKGKVGAKSIEQFWRAASELKKFTKDSMQSNLSEVREKQLDRIVQKAVEIGVLGTNEATRRRDEKAVYTFLG